MRPNGIGEYEAGVSRRSDPSWLGSAFDGSGHRQVGGSEAGDLTGTPLLEVEELTVSFGGVCAVDNVSLSIDRGDVYAIVGESGCGKSTLAYSLLNLVPPPGRISGGMVRFEGRALTRLSDSELRRIRGRHISIVFQAAMSGFNPVLTIGRQVRHLLEAHDGTFESGDEGMEYFSRLLRLVRLDPERVLNTYESRLSGGMKQRVAIAFALVLRPEVLVLDEPTTALDVLSQRLVIDIIRDLHDELGTTVVFVTHDLSVVAELADRLAVMYAGRLVEVGSVEQVFFDRRRHPYVEALLSAVPSIIADSSQVRAIPGQVPDLAALPPGCRFEPRCMKAIGRCSIDEPVLIMDESRHAIACHVANGGGDG
jgi:oligopeptide/dipeptide ABC transporter ATP-binding protein